MANHVHVVYFRYERGFLLKSLMNLHVSERTTVSWHLRDSATLSFSKQTWSMQIVLLRKL